MRCLTSNQHSFPSFSSLTIFSETDNDFGAFPSSGKDSSKSQSSGSSSQDLFSMLDWHPNDSKTNGASSKVSANKSHAEFFGTTNGSNVEPTSSERHGDSNGHSKAKREEDFDFFSAFNNDAGTSGTNSPASNGNGNIGSAPNNGDLDLLGDFKGNSTSNSNGLKADLFNTNTNNTASAANKPIDAFGDFASFSSPQQTPKAPHSPSLPSVGGNNDPFSGFIAFDSPTTPSAAPRSDPKNDILSLYAPAHNAGSNPYSAPQYASLNHSAPTATLVQPQVQYVAYSLSAPSSPLYARAPSPLYATAAGTPGAFGAYPSAPYQPAIISPSPSPATAGPYTWGGVASSSSSSSSTLPSSSSSSSTSSLSGIRVPTPTPQPQLRSSADPFADLSASMFKSANK